MSYSARILADSIAPRGARLVTFEVRFPRFILAEWNTHRMLSRNAASSRAIPVERMIAAVEINPFVPEYWGRNQRGMQAHQELAPEDAECALLAWLDARDAAIEHARRLLQIGAHKQLANRLLEPFSWVSVIVSATTYDQLFLLRCHADAQPEFRRIAQLMEQLYLTHEPTERAAGEWHLPMGDDAPELLAEGYSEQEVACICAARCARVSYLTHDGKRDPLADLELAERLLTSGHMSPFEHVARALPDPVHVANFVGWHQLRRTVEMLKT